MKRRTLRRLLVASARPCGSARGRRLRLRASGPGPTSPTIPIPRVNIGVTPATKPQDVAFSLQILLLLTVLALAPTLLVLMTSFTRIIVVLSFVRTALGTQQVPPTQVLVGLAAVAHVLHDEPGHHGHQQERAAAVSQGEQDLAVDGARPGAEAAARLHVQADPREGHRGFLQFVEGEAARPSRTTSRRICSSRRSSSASSRRRSRSALRSTSRSSSSTWSWPSSCSRWA